ncbi:MinD/ParA family ATP-binding protein [Pseudomonas migulae]|uniref:Flagellar biosynthesis protein FlhG n=1 Tax=Pseudomonas migulae TaxID=78543 RepID=A0A1H5H8V6_9PSED|nr:AAA family ATPase [Pseudomonas migulae]SEE24397.1 flagellar biosynthesis protein FlhG [Pseudomonas migulae]
MVVHDAVRVIALTGGKGGVGKTITAINLSVELSTMGRRVVLMDGGLGLANIDALLGLKPQYTLQDVIESRCEIRDTFIDGPAGVLIVPAASGVQGMVCLSAAQLGGLIYAYDELAKDIDILVVDTASGIGHSVVNLVAASSDILIVVCDEPASLVDAYSLIKLLHRQHGARRFKVLVNMTKSQFEGPQTFAKLNNVSLEFLGIALIYVGALPYDEHVKKAMLKRASVAAAYPKSKYSLALKHIARTLDRGPLNTADRGGVSFFLPRSFRRAHSEAQHEQAISEVPNTAWQGI